MDTLLTMKTTSHQNLRPSNTPSTRLRLTSPLLPTTLNHSAKTTQLNAISSSPSALPIPPPLQTRPYHLPLYPIISSLPLSLPPCPPPPTQSQNSLSPPPPPSRSLSSPTKTLTSPQSQLLPSNHIILPPLSPPPPPPLGILTFLTPIVPPTILSYIVLSPTSSLYHSSDPDAILPFLLSLYPIILHPSGYCDPPLSPLPPAIINRCALVKSTLCGCHQPRNHHPSFLTTITCTCTGNPPLFNSYARCIDPIPVHHPQSNRSLH